MSPRRKRSAFVEGRGCGARPSSSRLRLVGDPTPRAVAPTVKEKTRATLQMKECGVMCIMNGGGGRAEENVEERRRGGRRRQC